MAIAGITAGNIHVICKNPGNIAVKGKQFRFELTGIVLLLSEIQPATWF